MFVTVYGLKVQGSRFTVPGSCEPETKLFVKNIAP